MPLHRKDKDLDALVGELAAFPVFVGLDRASVKALAAAGRVVHLPAGWALMSEDTPADSCYVLFGGAAEVRHAGQVVAALGAGDLVGEAALVQQRRRNATVVSVKEVRALRLSYDDLTTLFAKHPGVEQAFKVEWDKRAPA